MQRCLCARVVEVAAAAPRCACSRAALSMIAPASVLRAEGRQARQSTMSRVATVAAVATPSAAVVAAAQTHPSCTANQQHRWRAYCSSASQPPSSSSEAPAAAADNQSSSTSGNATNTQPSSTISYTPSVMCGWVVNKQPINASMTPELYSYMLGLTKEHEVLAALREETAGIHGGHMQVSPEQGQFMAVLVKLLNVKTAIEVGVFTGYSSLAVALALPQDGRLVAFDRDAKTMEVAQKHWQLAGVADKVDARLGPGLEGLQQLLQETGPSAFDFAFIDADKGGYQAYFDLCLQLVRPGGCIAVDNVLFYGRVVDPSRDDKATVAIRRFNTALAADDRVDFSIVPIGDGVALCRKR